ncbi:MAG: hypothetical protein KF893_11670 [Caldilineaceae bacterium]|nr:hypothetical protein [Caldilineaceae bacterium]
MLSPSPSSTLKPQEQHPPIYSKTVPPAESVMEIIGLSITIGIFNAPSTWIKLIHDIAGPTVFVPIFSAELQSHLPMLNLFWGLALTLAFVRLYYQRRAPGILIAEILMILFGMQIAFSLLMSGPLLALDHEWITAQEISSLLVSTWSSLLDVINLVVKLAIGLGIFGSLVSLVQKGIELVRAVQR